MQLHIPYSSEVNKEQPRLILGSQLGWPQHQSLFPSTLFTFFLGTLGEIKNLLEHAVVKVRLQLQSIVTHQLHVQGLSSPLSGMGPGMVIW